MRHLNSHYLSFKMLKNATKLNLRQADGPTSEQKNGSNGIENEEKQ